METIVARGVAAVLAAASALPARGDLTAEADCVDAASARGYFLPDEEELIRLRYSQYLGLRAALLETLDGWRGRAGTGEGGVGGPAAGVRDRVRGGLCVDAGGPVSGGTGGGAAGGVEEARRGGSVGGDSAQTIHRGLQGDFGSGECAAISDCRGFLSKHPPGIRGLAGDPVAGPVVELLLAEEPRIDGGGAMR